MELPSFLWPLTILSVCALALWRGGDDERLAAGGMLGAWAFTMAVYRSGVDRTEWGIAVVDVALLVLLGVVALRSPRYWPIFAAGFHLLAVVTHMANTADQRLGAWVYLTSGIIWAYLVALAVGYGAWTHRGRQAAQEPSTRP